MKNLLVVEDHEQTLKSCTKNLLKIGDNINVFTAKSSEEALSILSQNNIAGRGSGLAKVKQIADAYDIRVHTDWKNDMIVFRLQFPE